MKKLTAAKIKRVNLSKIKGGGNTALTEEIEMVIERLERG